MRQVVYNVNLSPIFTVLNLMTDLSLPRRAPDDEANASVKNESLKIVAGLKPAAQSAPAHVRFLVSPIPAG